MYVHYFFYLSVPFSFDLLLSSPVYAPIASSFSSPGVGRPSPERQYVFVDLPFI